MVAVGGGTRGDLWTRIVLDVTGRRQEIPSETVGAALGDAMLAAMALNLADARAWNPIARTIDPDPTAAALYDRLYAVYRGLYPATREQTHEIAAVQAATSEAMRGPG